MMANNRCCAEPIVQWGISGYFNPVCTDQFGPDLGGQVKSD